jgi:hypothetical protein
MMETAVRQERLESLVLARLVAAEGARLARATLGREVSECAAAVPEDGARLVAAAIEGLLERGLLRTEGEQLELETAGRESLARTLRFDDTEALKEAPALGWEAVQMRLLATGPLGLQEVDSAVLERLQTPDGLRAFVLKQSYELSIRATCPSLPEVRDALAWMAIGRALGKDCDYSGRRKFGSGPVVQVVLNSLLDSEREYETRSVLTMLAMRAVNARNGTLPEMRRALFLRWLQEPVREEKVDQGARFVEELREIARHARVGRFGSNKVFIGHVFREMRRRFTELSRESFEKQLIEAHTRHQLTLARADLVEAMNPEDVRESEVRHLNSRFHFVRI